MRVVTLTLPMPPNVANGSFMGHWSKRRKAVNNWKALAILEGIPEQRTSTPRRVELTLTEVA